MTSEEFQREYQAVSNRLYAFLLRVTGDSAEAQELLQEAVYRAYKKRNSFRKESNFATWIYRIALNTRANKLKRRSIEENYLGHMKTVPISSSPLTPEDIFSGKEKSRELAMAIETLKDEYSIPLLLKHNEGYNYAEIGEMLGIEENAARKRVYRARHQLQSLLKEVLA